MCSPHQILGWTQNERCNMQGMWQIGGEGKRIQLFSGKPKGKELFERIRYRWEVNINIDFKVIE